MSKKSMKRFSPTKSITQKNLAKVPEGKPGVYRIKTAGDEVLYVGMAKRGRLPERIEEHKGRFKGGTQFQYRVVASKEQAEKIEGQEIKRLKPPRNRKK